MKLQIKHKLFFTIFLSSSLVALGLFFFLQWNFDRGFLNYVNNQEMELVGDLSDKLIESYSSAGGWDFLKGNHGRWISLHEEVFDDRPRRERPPRELRPLRRPAHPPDGPSFGHRIILFDMKKNHIIGGGRENIEDKSDLLMHPLTYQEENIGYIGLVQKTEVSASRDLQFVEQQTMAFALIALVMFVGSIVFTYPMAIHLLRPVQHLTGGTRNLIAGNYTTRIPVTTVDELGALSNHFNILANSLEHNEKARQQWIADISHELRTPIAIMRGEVEAVLDGVRQAGPATLEPVHSEILHLQRIVSDLYELSMSDIGALTYKRVLVNPLGILAGILEVFKKRFADKNMNLRVSSLETNNCSLFGDPDRLHQLFTNILENSLRYTNKPGVLEVTVEHHSDRIAIIFQDSEPGVDSTQLPLLFDRLYRADPSRKRASGGAGLGLAICTNIVEAHQGTVRAHSSRYGGLGITVELPFST